MATCKLIIEDEVNIKLDRRHPIDLNFKTIKEDFWGDKTWPKGHPAEGETIRLRDYQVEVVNNFLLNPQALQEVATGAGKTIITATLSQLTETYGRSLVIVPNKSLVTQTEEDYINCGLDVGVYFGCLLYTSPSPRDRG